MSAYEYILEQIKDGVESFVVAILAIYFYIISYGTFTQNDMSEENLALVMTKLGYTYNTSTNELTDGTTTYSIYNLVNKVISDYYPSSKPLSSGIIILMLSTLTARNKITSEQATTLKGLL